MPSPTFTERRIYRTAAILQAFQAAQGTPASDFSTVLSRADWMRDVVFDPGITKDDVQGSTGSGFKREEGRYLRDRKPVLTLRGGASPKNLEWLLRSWGGAWTGSPTLALGLTEGINEFATFGIVEKTPIPNNQKLIRIWDGWAWKIVLSMASGLSVLDLEAEIAARDFDRTTLTVGALAAAGITLPASFAPPAIDVFAPHQFRLYRDPAGANVSIAVEELRITLEHGLSHETWNDVAPQVVKDGMTKVELYLKGAWMDETYAIELDAETIPNAFKRFSAEWAVGSKSFIIDMKNVDFTASPIGWEENRWKRFEVKGEAYMNAAGDYVNISLTP